ncbi:hypothetical protein PENNAL_c0001G11423 [Penicillium nalgiovense]|uniref:Arrestin-like N-terminal domain-containing protein n=1 Tax=Penicillium nalgiovense TaxID=60175 RepID=A0A1V6ZAF9_PENNA|nr:hypothetical protein PENNAL_c0001G11423 [Penicillium nalgiovense]
MSLTLSLDNQKTCYSDNETISGHVTLRCPTTSDIQDHIRVVFVGRAKCRIQKAKRPAAPSAAYRSKCILFEKERILSLHDCQAPSNGLFQWPFEFLFPSHVQPSTSSRRWPETTRFYNDAGHPLPPTFTKKAEDDLRLLDCVIEYKIYAQGSKIQRGFLSRKSPFLSEPIRLSFMPASAKMAPLAKESFPRAQSRREEQLFNIRSMHLLPGHEGRNLSVQEKFQSWLSPGKLPHFSFNVAFSYQTHVVQSRPLSCTLDVDPVIENSSIGFPPQILMQSIHVVVTGQTAARATPSLVGVMSAEVDERIEIISRPSVNVPVSGSVDLDTVVGPFIFRHTDISFRTLNISRTYRLSVSVVFLCAGKAAEFKLSGLPIEVMASQDPDLKGGHENVSEDDSPPSYSPRSSLSMGICEPAGRYELGEKQHR